MGAGDDSAALQTMLASISLSLAAGLSVLLLGMAVAQARTGVRVGQRLVDLGLRQSPNRLGIGKAGRRKPFAVPMLHRIGAGLAQRWRQDRLRELRNDLVRAGVADRLSIEAYLGVRIVAVLAGAALGGTLATLAGSFALALLAMGALAGYLLPTLVLASLARRRRANVEQRLPAALDILAVCLEAGLAFDAAVVFLCERTHDQLTLELVRYLADVRLGRSRREALEAMVDRTLSADMAEFVTAVIRSDELGTSLARTLRTQARLLHAARRTKAEERARQAPVKLLFPLVLCIMPVLMIIILGPAALKVVNVFLGGQ